MELSPTIDKDIFKNYHYKLILKLLYLGFFLLLMVFLFLISVNNGEFDIKITKLFSKEINEKERYILYNIRILRALGALFVGGGLGFCGALMQIVLKNPMASPYTLGISQGAAFGATLAIIFGGGGILTSAGEGVILSSYFGVIISAFLGSVIAMVLLFSISFLRAFSIYTMILAGISIGALFSSMTMLVQYMADDMKAAATLFWTFGDISKSKWLMIKILSLVMLPSLVYFTFKGWSLNLFSFGKDFLKNAGIDYKKTVITAFLLVSLIVGIITSFVGIVGFVGLLSPHISRFFSKGDSRFLLVYSFVIGGITLLVSDMLSRFLFYPAVIPVGIITSFFGVIVLIYLILKGYDKT